MNAELGDRVQELFDQAVALPVERRPEFLSAACGGDAALKAEVEGLLAADATLSEGKEDFLKSPVEWAPAPAPTGLPIRVGDYRIIRFVAEGGSGSVYEAEQNNPRRTVALKVIRPGLTSPVLRARFHQETQILGRLNHPGIAKVYEAGFAEDGRPFFVMEFVRGQPLNEYSRLRALTVAARLELFTRVCDAVQHAHEQSVVHRDLKPANILVDATGQPKVLDFGVARVIDLEMLGGAGLTRTGQFLGTPSYMSPEQLTAHPDRIDHRSDVYALGVILFELLALRLPHQIEHQALAEITQTILEGSPPRLGAINPELRGDPETIVSTAMDKEPARRYSSAAALAADVRRFLADEPILARPASALYRLRQFTRRNKTLVGGTVTTVAALVLGLIGTILFAVGESRQRDRAEHNAGVARAEKREAEFQTYRARLAAATSALEADDVADALRHLAAAPEELRDWEWRHLRSRLDGSSSVTPLPPGRMPFILAEPDRLRYGIWTPDWLLLADLEGGGQTTAPIGSIRHDSHVTATRTALGFRIAGWVDAKAIQVQDEAGQIICRVAMTNAKRPEPIAISADGTTLASSWQEGPWTRLGVFDATTGKLTATCSGHRNTVWTYAFSPDGKTLASAGDDQTVRLWHSGTGALLGTCEGHTGKVGNVAFRPDGARLLSISADGTVRQWDAATGRQVETPYERHSGAVGAAAYSPCGRWIASGGYDRTVRIWQAAGRQDVTVLHGHTGPVVRIAFAADGRRVASFSNSWITSPGTAVVAVWDLDTQSPFPSLRGHTQPVLALSFSADGCRLASGSSDGMVRLWDAATGLHCATLPHNSAVPSLAFVADGTRLVTLQRGDNRLRVWSVAAGSVLKELEGPTGTLRSMIVSTDGKRAAVTAHDGQPDHFHVYDLESGERLHSATGSALAYSPDGRWLAVQVVGEWTVLLLDAQTHETSARFVGHQGVIWGASFSPDGRQLATGGRDRTVRLWQIDGGDCRVLRGHTDDIFAVAFHPDGKRLATAGRDRAVWLWDEVRGEEVARLPGHTSYIRSLAFSPDGATLASGSGDTTVRLWDTMPLKVRYQLRREVEAARPEAARLVERLFAELPTPEKVVSCLRSDRSLGPAVYRAAMQEVLRRGGN